MAGDQQVIEIAAAPSASTDDQPLGIIALNASGALVANNSEAVSIVGRIPPGRFGRRVCCELFGCRASGTPLDGICLTEHALEHGQVPEALVELPYGRAYATARVKAARAEAHEPIVTLTVRPGAPSRSHAGADARAMGVLRIRVLGETRIESLSGAQDGEWLEQRAGQLLKFLVCHRGRVARSDDIGSALWPQHGVRANANVRYFVRRLRNHLEPARRRGEASSFVIASRGGYLLAPGRVEIDADVFERLLRDGAMAFARRQWADAKSTLERALALYRGEFLADEPYAVWALGERERLHELAAQGHRMLVELHADSGELDAAARRAEALVDLEPWDSEVQRAVLVLCLRRGRRSEAVRRYRLMVQAVQREFGETLDFALSELRADHDLRLA